MLGRVLLVIIKEARDGDMLSQVYKATRKRTPSPAALLFQLIIEAEHIPLVRERLRTLVS